MSADTRREAVVAAALPHFARNGFRAASMEAIARDAGVSQPYLFRLFGTKRALFLACMARNLETVRGAFAEAAAGVDDPGERRGAMGRAYIALLGDRDQLLTQLQGYAACADPEIREAVRWGFGELVALVARETGASGPELWAFFAQGMLLNVAAALDLPEAAAGVAWAGDWSDPQELMRGMTITGGPT
jgi:AcrR family transcriptional regulator